MIPTFTSDGKKMNKIMQAQGISMVTLAGKPDAINIITVPRVWRGGRKWVGKRKTSRHLGATAKCAESQGCCQHEHSDLEEKSTSAPFGKQIMRQTASC